MTPIESSNHLGALNISGFKCFNHLRLEFGSLTLITGYNGAGKSSALQPLLLLAQGLRETRDPRAFPLNGPLVRLGAAGDVVPAEGQTAIGFSVSGPSGSLGWRFSAQAGDRWLRVVEDLFERPGAQDLTNTLARLTFMSAIRGGSADAYPIPDSGPSDHVDVGSDGRYAPYWYDQMADNEVAPERRNPTEGATTFRKQVDAWLGTLFPGAQANVQLALAFSKLALQFRLSEIGAWRRPANIGYGLTYCFPILVSLLGASVSQIVIIDSPEAHLHPYAQSQMGRLLARFASSGVQIVVETHSDHLLNGVRLAIREKSVDRSTLRVHFFRGAGEDGHGVLSLNVDAQGRVDEWPEGFFDQSERDLAQLTGWA